MLCDPDASNNPKGNVCHTADLGYVFNSLTQVGSAKTPDQVATANLMSGAWGDFANNYASPTSGPGANWKPWGGAKGEINTIKAGALGTESVETLRKTQECTSLWDQYLAK